MVHLKQLRSSDMQPIEVQNLLKQLADERFSENENINSNVNPGENLKKVQIRPYYYSLL